MPVEGSSSVGSEEDLYRQRSKIYRFRSPSWEEAGLGVARLLKNEASGKVRFRFEDEKQKVLVANHLVVDHPPYYELRPSAGSEKIWEWIALDYSGDEKKLETFALKFGSADRARQFHESFEEAKQLNSQWFLPELAEHSLTPPDTPSVELPASAGAALGADPEMAAAEATAAGAHSKRDDGYQATGIKAPVDIGITSGATAAQAKAAASPFHGTSLFGGGQGSTAPGSLFGSSSSTPQPLMGQESFQDCRERDEVQDEAQQHGASSAPAKEQAAQSTGGPWSGAAAGGLFAGTSPGGQGLLGGSASSGGFFSSMASGGVFSGSSSGGLFSNASSGSSTTGATSGGLFSGGLFSAPAASSSASSGGFFSAASTPSASPLNLFSTPTAADAAASKSNPFAGLAMSFSSPAPSGTSGGGLFSSSAATASAGPFAASTTQAPAKDETAEQDNEYVEEEEIDIVPGWAPSLTLDVMDSVETGEEQEEVIYVQRAKLLRFREGDWKERGIGDVKLLKHRETGMIRFMLRQEKTMKIVGNHYVLPKSPYCELKPNAGSDKIWQWMALDYSDGEMLAEQLALKFRDAELAQRFKETFESARADNAKAMEPGHQTPQAVKEADKGSSDAPEQPKSKDVTGATYGTLTLSSFAGFNLHNADSGIMGDVSDPYIIGRVGDQEQRTKVIKNNLNPVWNRAEDEDFCFQLDISDPSEKMLKLQVMDQNNFRKDAFLGSLEIDIERLTRGETSRMRQPLQDIDKGELEFDICFLPEQAAALDEGERVRQPSVEEVEAAEAAQAAQEELLAAQALAASQAPQATVEETQRGLPSPGSFGEDAPHSAGPTATENGEEQEEAIYCQRAKLYRFRDGEWRERGLGEARLLQQVQTGMVRFELRKESTGEVVGNHWVIADGSYCQLTASKNSDRSWMWTAQDCSEDGEPRAEKLALKFKSTELAQEFKEAFDRVKENNSAFAKERLGQPSTGDVNEVSQDAPEQPAAEEATEVSYGMLTLSSLAGHNLHNSDTGLFGDVSDPYVLCRVSDSEQRTKTIKDNLNPVWTGEEFQFPVDISDPSEKTLHLKVMSANNFRKDSFLGSMQVEIDTLTRGEKSRIRQKLKDIDKGELEFEICFQPGLVPTEGDGYAEKEEAAAKADEHPATEASRALPSPAEAAPASEEKKFNPFASMALGGSASETASVANPFAGFSGAFGGGAAPATAEQPAATTAQEQDDDYVPEEEVTVVPGWTASITMEVKDNIETGEEEEEELYVQRSKLLRFRDGEWKERGLGDAKLLKHRETGRVRFMLRQEKTMKIVGNHYVIDRESLCNLQPNGDSDKIWCWLAQDYSDGDPAMEKFALKFKTPEQATQFQEAFNEAKVLNKAAFAGEDGTSAKIDKAPAEVAEAPKPKEEEGKASGMLASKSTANLESPWAGPAAGGLFASSSGAATRGLFSGAASVSTSGGLFASPATTGGLFSGTPTPSSGGLFSSTSSGGGGLFSGAASSSSAPAGGGLFAAASSGASSGGLFSAASPATASSPSSGGLFSGASASSGGLFSTGGLFSSLASASSGSASSGGLFSSTAPSGTTSSSASSGGFFSSLTPTPSASASSSSSQGSLFSSGASSGGSSPNPFAGLSMFGSSAATPAPAGGLFSSAAAASTGSTFASAAANSSGGLFSSPAPVASADAAAPKEAAEQEEDQYVVEEEVTHVPGWTPSVSLDVKDNIETGEEEEEVLYSQRAKLLRFRDGDWKERGLGDAKLLKHRETGKVRFMLRQEKTMKIVSNHYIIDHKPYCDLKLNSGSDKCWMWFAQDYSDGEPADENYALKFRSAELAEAFKESFNQAKEINSKVLDLGASSSSKAAQPEAKATPKATAVAAAVPKKAAAPAPAEGGLFAPASTGSLFSSAAPTGGLFSSTPSSGGLFSTSSAGLGLFSAPSAGGSAASSGGGGLFSSPTSTGGGLFSSTPSASSGGIFSFSAPVTPAPGAASATAGNEAPDQQQGDDDRFVVEEEVTVVPGWTPSVNLEVRNDVATGEEEEIQVYAQRSKLRRFKDKEWKERGTGEAKLLKNPQTGVVRFLLRQEKTMKIVANHVVIQHDTYCNLVLNSGSEKIWVWTALDCSDSETPVAEQFALAFGNAELAAKFKEEFNQAKTQPSASANSSAGLQTAAKASPAKASPPQVVAGAVSKSSHGASPPASAPAPDPKPSSSQEDSKGAFYSWDSFQKSKFEVAGEQEEEEDEEDGEEDDNDGAWDVTEDVSAGLVPSQPCGSLAEMAAQQAASGWRCELCRMIWSENAYECGVCEIPRPGYEEKAAEEEQKKTSSLEAAKNAFLGGGGGNSSAKASGFTFSPPASGVSTQQPAGGVVFGFGSGAASSSPALFGAGAGTGTFGGGTASGSTSLFGSVQAEPKAHVPVVVPPPAKAPIFGSGGISLGGPSAGASLFGNAPASAGGLFAAQPAAPPPPPPPPPPPAEVQPVGAGLFGAPATAAKASPAAGGASLFGAGAASSGSSLFGAPATSAGASLFGASASSSKPLLFGVSPASSGAAASESKPLFGASPASSSGSSLFGGATPALAPASGAPQLFGGASLFGGSSASSGASVFGGAPASSGASLFGAPAASSGPSLFGGGSSITNAASASSSGSLLSASASAPAKAQDSEESEFLSWYVNRQQALVQATQEAKASPAKPTAKEDVLPKQPTPPRQTPQQSWQAEHPGEEVRWQALKEEMKGHNGKIVEEVKELRDACMKAEERARSAEEAQGKLEQQLDALRRTQREEGASLEKQIDTLRRTQKEEGESLQQNLVLLRAQQDGGSTALNKLSEALRQEKASREEVVKRQESLEASLDENKGRVHTALMVAEEARRVAVDAQQVSNALTDKVKGQLEDFKEQLHDFKNKVSLGNLEALKKLTVPERIMYFQKLQKQRVLDGPAYLVGKENGEHDRQTASNGQVARSRQLEEAKIAPGAENMASFKTSIFGGTPLPRQSEAPPGPFLRRLG